MEEKKTQKVPRIYLPRLEGEFIYSAQALKNQYERYVLPVLSSFGLLDVKHVKKFLRASSMREVYEEALRVNGGKIVLLEQLAALQKMDLWKSFREPGSNEKLTPKDEGFVFAWLPYSGTDEAQQRKELLAECINVSDDCKLSLDKDKLRNHATFPLSAKQRELYLLTSEYCENLKKLGVKGLCPNTLFRYKGNPRGGHLVPNTPGICSIFSAVEIWE